jgi:formate hydrogenlyase subunit 6/NADH:ubiquinone oxidoreductase subunit I
MPTSAGVSPLGQTVVLNKPELQVIIDRLWQEGYTVVGPTISQQAITFDELRKLDQLPIGWTDVQEGATYRLTRRDDDAYFGYNVGPHSWKKYLFPPRLRLYSIEREDHDFRIEPNSEPAPRYAFLGARSCDLHAIEIQDRTFLHGPFVDPHYRARRANNFVIAVNCSQAAATCFCTSMQTGPKAERGFDLALTELPDLFVIEIATQKGAELLEVLPHRPATGEQLGAAARVVRDTAARMKRRMDTNDLPELLYDNLDHPRWDDVAQRCLSCTNCTMVCPTCFCHSIEDVPDLDGQRADRVRLWDSCFNPDHSYAAGGLRRPDIRSRYRQWLTHKLASWVDQFGVSGCVGCGRCITWCPVAIDITEEVAAIRENVPHGKPAGHLAE